MPLVLNTTLQITPDVRFSATAFQSLRDGGGFGVTTLQVTPVKNVDLALTAQLPYRLWGRTSELAPGRGDLVLIAPAPGGGNLAADLNGLAPEATIVAWARYAF